MRTILMTMTLFLAAAPAWAQDKPPRFDEPAKERDLRRPTDERTDDLWYAAPGVRPGGDLLSPLVDLVRNPSGLLDLKPRKVRSWLPDRETAEFLRDRR